MSVVFWLAAALVSAAAAAGVIWRASRIVAADGESPETAVYRRHLAELDDLRGRGLLDEDGYAAARAEAGRRLLAAEDRARPVDRTDHPRRDRLLVAAAAAGAVVVALGLYIAFGSPGTPDQPYAARLKAWRAADPATLDAPRLAAVLADLVKERPKDPQLWAFLGRAQAEAGDPLAAARSLEQSVRLQPERADTWAALGEAFVQLGEGEVGDDARRAFDQALKLDPASPTARYFLGRAEIDAGRRDQGLAMWRAVAASLPADDPRRAALRGEIARVERGSDSVAAAVASAAPEEQAQMIRGMVEGLAARLEAEPDDPQGWARLVRAYGVLGDDAAQQQALLEARRQFADRPTELAQIEAAARK